MLYNVWIYILSIVTTNVLISLVIALLFVRFDKKKTFAIEETLIYSAALGPALVSLCLYYLLLLLPHNSSFFYFAFIYLIFLLLLMVFRSSFLQLQSIILTKVRKIKWDNKTLFYLGIAAGVALIIVWQYSVMRIPILRHDTFEYATWGNNLYQSKVIEYKESNYNSNTGFYYVAKHGLLFPLFVTWGSIYNEVFGAHSDYYFRSITGWYWILILLLIFYEVSKKDTVAAILGVISLALVPAFSASLIYYHLDTYRIFFLMATLTTFIHAIKSDENFSIIVFGILGGIMASAHSIGAIFISILCLIYFMLVNIPFSKKVKNLVAIGILIMLFGGIHYLLDTIFGTGWVWTL